MLAMLIYKGDPNEENDEWIRACRLNPSLLRDPRGRYSGQIGQFGQCWCNNPVEIIIARPASRVQGGWLKIVWPSDGCPEVTPAQFM